jgi:ribonucleoside-diphosphate reductase beta chain
MTALLKVITEFEEQNSMGVLSPQDDAPERVTTNLSLQEECMTHEIFTTEWIAAWAQRINQSEAYKQAARAWEWPVILELEEERGEGAGRQIYLDLWRGACREAREAHEADCANAPYVLRATRTHWEQTLRGELDPLLAIARGKIKLQKGSLFALARYGNAAKQLAATAREVGAEPLSVEAVALNEKQNGARATVRDALLTTSAAGLRHDIFPMRLYHKAKKLGVWDPRDIDLRRDREDWRRLDESERTVILHLTALFQSGEESVTLDLLPVLDVMAREGRLEEEMYLSTFLFEEAKHTEFCRRFLDEVAEAKTDLAHFHTPAYRKLFYEALPRALNRLREDSSAVAQIEAAATYNMIVEGTLAETGYHAYFAMLERHGIMPGLRAGLALLKRDEARHIAYGLYWISRLLAAQPSLWTVLENRLAALLDLSVQSINEVFDLYNPMPFGLQREAFVAYALEQFSARTARLEAAKFLSLAEIEQGREEGRGGEA